VRQHYYFWKGEAKCHTSRRRKRWQRRNICPGIWDFMTGKLKYKLANSVLGAIITHALVNEAGSYIVAAESGDLLYWDMATRCEMENSHTMHVPVSLGR
jgi:hypothetical protein